MTQAPPLTRRIWLSILSRKRLIIAGAILYVILVHAVYDGVVKFKKQAAKKRQDAENQNSPLTLKNTLLNIIGDVDLHLGDTILGHTGETKGHALKEENEGGDSKLNAFLPVTAIGLGITSKKIKDASEPDIWKNFQFFSTFLRSFCKTASKGYQYDFYLAFDNNDPMFTKSSFLRAFQETFYSIVAMNCKDMQTSIHMVQCDHAGTPTRAQNDAMLEAYLDNAEYYYRINDDSLMGTGNWTDAFVKTLGEYDPPNVGVVGPAHRGGNVGILTYDFVHRTHIDIFGYYYPRLFSDWYGDNWITNIYVPGRMAKLKDINLIHTMKMGRRYELDNSVGGKLHKQIKKDQKTLARYLRYINETKARNTSDVRESKKIISMSLYGKDPVYTWGAIRNAQLTPVHFPGWQLRVYIWDDSFASNITQNCSTNDSLAVPRRIISKLRQLGAEITTVQWLLENCTACMIPPKFWRYLVIDDPVVEYFIIRDADSRLSDRDAYVVHRWLETTKMEGIVAPLHCIRDHPKHSDKAIVDGLWGGHALSIRLAIAAQNQSTMMSMLDQFYTMSLYFTVKNESDHIAVTLTSSNVNDSSYNLNTSHKAISFLEFFIWPVFKSRAMCHDSTSCEVVRWNSNNIHPVHRKRTPPSEYLGQKYDEHHELTSKDGELLDKFFGKECSNNTKSTTK